MRNVFCCLIMILSFSHFAGEDEIKTPEFIFGELRNFEGEVELQANIVESYMANLKHLKNTPPGTPKNELLLAEYIKRDNLIRIYKKNKNLLEEYRLNFDLNPKGRKEVMKSLSSNLDYLKPLIRLPAPPRVERAIAIDIEKVLNEAKLNFKNKDYAAISLLMCWPHEVNNREIHRMHIEWLTKNNQSMLSLIDQVLRDQSNWYLYEHQGQKRVVLFPNRKDIDNLKNDVCIHLELIPSQKWRLVSRMIFVWQAPLSEFFAIDKTDLK